MPTLSAVQMQPVVEIDDDTHEFLRLLWRGGKWAYFFFIDEVETYQTKEGEQESVKLTHWFPTNVARFVPPRRPTAHYYFGVHPTTEPRKSYERATQSIIASVGCLFAEYDAKDWGTREAMLAQIDRLPFAPSVVIDSGGGFHCYWLLIAPFIITTEEDRNFIRAVQRRWVRFVEGDDVKDLTRVLRLPGSRNIKPKYAPDYPTVEYERFDLGKQYVLATLIAALPPEQDEQRAHLSVRRDATYRHALNGQSGVIDIYNARVTIQEALLAAGYTPRGKRFCAPGADRSVNSSVVILEDNTSYHWDTSDKLCDGHRHSPFDVYCQYTHDGDVRAAVRAIAEAWQIPYPARHPQIVNGIAYCPDDGTELVPAKNGNGFICPTGEFHYWWAGEGYVCAGDTDDAPFNDTTPALPVVDPTLDMPAHPALPDFEIGRSAGRWLNAYVSYARQVAPMSPVAFHETAGLWLFSVAIARRLKVHMPFAEIYPNLYIVWIAGTTIWGKTTSMNIARDLARHAFAHLLAPQDTTPETMISDMSGRAPTNEKDLSDDELRLWREERNFAAQRGVLIDEMSALLSGAQREYNTGLLESYMRFYDCEAHYVRSTKGAGRVVVRNAYVSLLGASTPALMAQHLNNPTMWANGFWPRFAIITPDTDAPCDIESPEHVERNPRLLEWLGKTYARLPRAEYPTPAAAWDVPIDPDAREMWRAYSTPMRKAEMLEEVDERLRGAYGRMPVQVLKVAILLAAMDWPTSAHVPRITIAQMARAIELCESWRASVHRALRAQSDGEQANVRRRVLRIVARAGSTGVPLRDIGRAMKDVDTARLELALGELERLEEIESFKPTGPGRPTKKYRIPRA